MALHLVLSRPGRLTLAEGPAVELLREVQHTDDPRDILASLHVMAHGGPAPSARVEQEWGPQLREIHAVLSTAAGIGTGPLGQRLHG